MKWRPFLIIFLGLFILMLIMMMYSMGYNGGIAEVTGNPESHDLMKIPETVKTAEKLKFVSTDKVKNQSYLVNVNALGRVTSSQAISISSEVQGKLRQGSVRLKKGTSFRKGQTLFSISNSDAALMLKSRKSTYLNLIANALPDIKLDYPNDFEVWNLFFNAIDVDRGLPPMPPLVNPKLKTLLASRNIISEYYNIKADQVRLSKYSVVAPFSGTITESFADVGSTINPGAPVINIMNDKSLEVECAINPDEIGLISNNAPVILTDDKNNKWEGIVSRKGQFVNPNTQSIPVFISVSDDVKSLYNGMYLNADIKGDSVKNVFMIPRRSILTETNSVYTLKDSSLKSTPIMIIKTSDEEAIVGGLSDGEILVTEPIIKKSSEMKFAAQK